MTLEVRGHLEESGFTIRVGESEYRIDYPEWVWEATPERLRRVLLDNIAYAATMHLPMVVPDVDSVSYDTARPLFEPYFFQNFLRDIPSCTDIDGRSAERETMRFLSVDYRFSSEPMALPAPGAVEPGDVRSEGKRAGAIVPMSFGKDSLLTYALADELGLAPLMVYFVESSFGNERSHKITLGEEFKREFGRGLAIVEHETGALRDADHLGVPRSEYGWGLQSTEYALLAVPFAVASGASYILFGNEQSAGSSYLTEGGAVVYPCYDQTHLWTQHIDSMTSRLTGNAVRTGSLIEPLMDMMVQRILIRRYPHFARYQMSCFAEGEAGIQSRWCHDCSVCAKMYLLCVAGNVDPFAAGFTRPMLTNRTAKHVPLLDGASSFPYARTELARDEQLFAFLCAHRFGSDSELVRRFSDSPLMAEAERRERELWSRFCTLYPTVSTPAPLRERTLEIFREELVFFTSEYQKA